MNLATRHSVLAIAFVIFPKHLAFALRNTRVTQLQIARFRNRIGRHAGKYSVHHITGVPFADLNPMTSTEPNGDPPRRPINGWSVAISLILSFLFASVALAEKSPQAAAIEIAKAANKKSAKTILVLDFGGPKGATVLGEKLADQFSGLIAGSGVKGIQVADRTKIPQAAHGMSLERQWAANPWLGEALAERLEASSYVTGKIADENKNNGVTVKIEFYINSQEAPIKSFELSCQTSLEMSPLLPR